MNAADLKAFALLSELSDAERELLGELLEERNVSGGAPLFREGSEAEGLVLLAEGEVRLERRHCDDRLTLGPGSSLGGLSVLAIGSREVTAIAESRCRYWLLERTAFLRLAEDAPRTACRLAEAIACEVAGLLRQGLPAVVECLPDR